MSIKLPPEILALFKKAGRKGGQAKSEAKTRACRINAQKPRKKKS
jgi:hypothetical protein